MWARLKQRNKWWVDRVADKKMKAFPSSCYALVRPARPATPTLSQMAKRLPADEIILVNVCGRGDKDMQSVADFFEEDV